MDEEALTLVPPPAAATRRGCMVSPRVSYALRCGLAIGAASLLCLVPTYAPRSESLLPTLSTLLAPVFAGICAAPPHLGAALRNTRQSTVGLVAGGAASAAALAAFGYGSDARALAALVPTSLAVLLAPGLPALAAKVAQIVVVASLFSAKRLPDSFDLLFPAKLVLASFVGVVCGILCSAVPWPHSRACSAAEGAACAGERAAAALGAAAARALGDDAAAPAAAAALRSRLEGLRAAAASSSASLRSLRDGVAEEAAVGCKPPRRLAARTAALDGALLAADGVLLALEASRSARTAHARAALRHHLRRVAASAGDDATVPDDGGDGDAHDVAEASIEHDNRELERLMAAPSGALGDAAAAALLASSREDGTCDASERAERGTLSRAEAAAAVTGSLAAFDDALLRARAAIFYRHGGATQLPEFSSDPPVEHYAFFFFIREWALRCAATCAPLASQEPPPLAPRRSIGAMVASAGALPSRARCVYAVKLTAASVCAALVGNASCGNAIWAVIAVNIVGARDGVFLGAPFRTAAARASGTAAAAAFSAALLAASEAATGAPTVPAAPALLAPMAAWAVASSAVRFSPAHAYSGMVSSYTPYVITFDPEAGEGRNFAYRRLEQNLLGLACFALIELGVAPEHASRLLPGAAARALRAAAAAASAAWAPALTRCPACASAAAAQAASALAALREGVAQQNALLAEAAGEPELWMPHRRRRVLGCASPAAASAWRAAVDAQAAPLATLLALMCASAAPDAATARALRGVAAPVAPALRALLRRLATLLRALADELESVDSGGLHPHVFAGLDDSLEALEARHGAAVVRLRLRVGDAATSAAAIPPSEAMLSLHALMLCTRLLVRAAHDVGRAVRALLPATKHGDEDDDDDTGEERSNGHGHASSTEMMTRERSTAQLLDDSGDEELASGRCECGARILNDG
jgi:hypothetical protein